MSNNILNETFQKHLGLLKKKLNEADQGELPLSTLVPQLGTQSRMKKNPNPYDSSDISKQTKENLWNDFKSVSVKDFVDKYGKEFSDPKFHAFISAGLGDKINDESFKVTQVSPLVTTLIPTQNEIGFGNSLNDLIKKEYNESVQLVELDNMLNGKNVKLKAKTGEVPIVIFNGKYIIDGHHRWSKIYCANKTATVFCLNFESPVLKNDPSMALKAFHLAIAKMLRNSPTENKSGKNLFDSNRNEIYQYIYEYLFSPPGYSSPFLDVFKKHSNLINSNLNEAEQQFLIDPKTTLNTKALNPASADPFAKTVSLYIANNAQALISNNKPATDTPRSHMPQTDRAPGYEDALEKGEINFLRDKVTEKMVNETFQRHLKLLHNKLNLNEDPYYQQLPRTGDNWHDVQRPTGNRWDSGAFATNVTIAPRENDYTDRYVSPEERARNEFSKTVAGYARDYLHNDYNGLVRYLNQIKYQDKNNWKTTDIFEPNPRTDSYAKFDKDAFKRWAERDKEEHERSYKNREEKEKREAPSREIESKASDITRAMTMIIRSIGLIKWQLFKLKNPEEKLKYLSDYFEKNKDKLTKGHFERESYDDIKPYFDKYKDTYDQKAEDILLTALKNSEKDSGARGFFEQ
jgi:hypothetical protein